MAQLQAEMWLSRCALGHAAHCYNAKKVHDDTVHIFALTLPIIHRLKNFSPTDLAVNLWDL